MLCESVSRLAFHNGAGGADASAGAAADASVLVDFVDVAFADSSNGAFVDAGAASNTDVGDFVSHLSLFLGLILQYFLLQKRCKSTNFLSHGKI